LRENQTRHINVKKSYYEKIRRFFGAAGQLIVFEGFFLQFFFETSTKPAKLTRIE
jgi:hypothetical protein